MGTTPMGTPMTTATAAINYRADPTVAALLGEWERTRRPPLVLVDALLDLGAEAEAEAVRWAVAVPDRRVCGGVEFTGLFPWEGADQHGDMWFWDTPFDQSLVYSGSADYLPVRLMGVVDERAPRVIRDWGVFNTVADALCGFIDGFVEWDRQGRPE
jgi:hypothetical protein